MLKESHLSGKNAHGIGGGFKLPGKGAVWGALTIIFAGNGGGFNVDVGIGGGIGS